MTALKTPRQQRMVAALGELAWQLVLELTSTVAAGQTTAQLAEQAQALLAKNRCTAPFKSFTNAQGERFGWPVCVSLNAAVVNGPPSDAVVVAPGDVVSVALAVEREGLVGKAAHTVVVEALPGQAAIQRAITGAQQVLDTLPEQAPLLATVLDLTRVLEQAAWASGAYPITESGGHGTGLVHQSEPWIPNATADVDATLATTPLVSGWGLVPMPMWAVPVTVKTGDPRVVAWHLASDGWTYVVLNTMWPFMWPKRWCGLRG
ncbi:MAG: M24 family metallopeptidase [Vampirovibrionales bacterium]